MHIPVQDKRFRAAVSDGTFVPRWLSIVREDRTGSACLGACIKKQHVHLNLAKWCFRGMRLPGTSAVIHVFCGLFLRVAFLLSQGKIRHRTLEPGSHCSLVSPPEERIYWCSSQNKRFKPPPKRKIIIAKTINYSNI